ncbi:MAG: radical SAM protein [Dethiobacteria bacterium]|jgi:putative pyruvate formate lyase activating enzyme|nr:radical SAM protein [Bacillota bacterium]
MKPFPKGHQHPVYLSLSEEQWEEKLQRSRELASPCILCGRRCHAPRFKLSISENTRSDAQPAKGICETQDKAAVSSVEPHFGEEPPLVRHKGSGTIFFAGCNLKCIYCQNYDLAHHYRGKEVNDEELGQLMLQVQELGCHNVNLVSPTHVVPNIIAAVRLATRQGLRIPLVYNTGGYDSLETIKVLEGVVDIYMPDMKYGDPEPAKNFSGADDYPEINFAAVKEMHRQVGDLVIGENNVAVRGLLVRHLVLPGGVAGTKKVMEFLANNVSRDTYVNIMAQYRPCYKAVGHPQLGRRIKDAEYLQALEIAAETGLRRIQAL